MKMPFGKYMGEDIEDLPSSYLKWLAENIGEDTEERKAVCAYADREYKWREKHNILRSYPG